MLASFVKDHPDLSKSPERIDQGQAAPDVFFLDGFVQHMSLAI